MTPQHLQIVNTVLLLIALIVFPWAVRRRRAQVSENSSEAPARATPMTGVGFVDGRIALSTHELAAELVAAFREGLKPIPQVKDCGKCKGSGKIQFSTPSDLTTALRASLLEEIKASRRPRR
jgi:hypothetical protein